MLEIINVEKLKESLGRTENILIVVGDSYSLDELAAALSLGLSLEKAAKKVKLFSHKAPLVEEASLFGVSKLVNAAASGKLIISIPEALESVDKVTHYLDGETLNIVVHPANPQVRLSPAKIKISTQEELPDLIILLNSSWNDFVNTLNTQDQKIYSDIPKFAVGRVSDESQEVTWISSLENACISEIVTWTLAKLDLPIDSDCASNLFQGMQSATKFLPPVATANTFAAASICLEKRPVLPKTPGAEVNLENFFSKQDLGQPSQDILSNIGKTFPQTGTSLAQTKNLSQQTDDAKLDPSFDQQSSEVQSDWLAPKIFKSSQKTNKT